DLEEAISMHREALQLLPALHPVRSTSLNDFALALWTWFKNYGRQEDLEEAISLHPHARPARILAVRPLRCRLID
ncbi:hypothetical protein JB92DRAFT_2756991, partial [Gautieria morchelliformis]